MGLIWRVVPPDDVLAEARALADRLVRAAPLAQRATKEMAARGAHLPWEDALRLGESMRRVVGGTEDASEGMQAAHERRDPRGHTLLRGMRHAADAPMPRVPGGGPTRPEVLRRVRDRTRWPDSGRA